MNNKLEIQAIIKHLKEENENTTMEGELLKRKMIRQLYKLVGTPTKEDFPEECETAGDYWYKHTGYTTGIEMGYARNLEARNAWDTNWYVQRPSRTKIEIVERYVKAGWHCAVQAYNVMCTKCVKHPRIDNLWVEFYSSRDCNKYEYVIELGENE